MSWIHVYAGDTVIYLTTLAQALIIVQNTVLHSNLVLLLVDYVAL